MLQISWMSPHKPDPPSRPVEVDLSEILTPPEELKRAESSRDLESGSAFSQWNDSPVNEPHARLGSSGWTNIIFAVCCCLVALCCARSIFDTVEHFRRAVHAPTDVAYRRLEPNSATSQTLTLERWPYGSAVPVDHSMVNSLGEKMDSSRYSPTLSRFLPFREDQGLALPNTGGIADRASTNNSSSAPSAGVAMKSMSQEGSSTHQNSSEEQTTAERSNPRTGMRHAQKSISSSRTRISAWQRLRSFFSNRLGNSPAGKSSSRVAARTSSGSLKFGADNGQRRTAAAQTMPGRGAMATHSMAGAVGTMQNRAAINCMPMQHGMLAPPALGGLGGLNSAGLGGAGNHGGNARR